MVVSSGARSYMELRGPQDVINLATLFGLTVQQAQAAVTSAPAAVLQRAVARRAYRGTVAAVRLRTAQELAAKRQQLQKQEEEKQHWHRQQQGGQQAMDVDQPLRFVDMAGR